jgi:hypothetical protein
MTPREMRDAEEGNPKHFQVVLTLPARLNAHPNRKSCVGVVPSA